MKTARRPILVLAIWVLALCAPWSAHAEGDLQFASLGACALEGGGSIPDCRLGYRTFGTLDANASNVILVTTFLSGTSAALIPLIGPHEPIDSSKFYVVVVDAFGNGVSSSPSNTPLPEGTPFPAYTIRDMVNAQYRLLTEKLGVRRLYAVTGISMGGIQTFQWAVSYPDFVEKAIPILGTPRLTSYGLMLWQSELNVIEPGLATEQGRRQAMRMVAGFHALRVRTPRYIAETVNREDVQKFLAEQQATMSRIDARDFVSQIKAIMAHDICRPGESLPETAKRIKAKMLVIVAQSDEAIYNGPPLALAHFLSAPTVTLTGDCGHLSTICDRSTMTAALAAFLVP